MLTEHRSGSHLLNEALNFYSPLQCINEIFLNHIRYQDKKSTPFNTYLTIEQRNQLFDFLNVENKDQSELMKKIKNNPVESICKLYEITPVSLVVKIHRTQIRQFHLDELLQLPFVEVIILQRSNRIARYVSLLKAYETDNWHRVDTSHLQVSVNEEEFLQLEKLSKEWFEKIKQQISSKNYLEVNYERDLENLNKDHFYSLFDPWFEKINLSVTKTSYKLKYFNKQNNSKLQYSVLNYDEIKHLI